MLHVTEEHCPACCLPWATEKRRPVKLHFMTVVTCDKHSAGELGWQTHDKAPKHLLRPRSVHMCLEETTAAVDIELVQRGLNALHIWHHCHCRELDRGVGDLE